jgi:translation initiation factor 2 subunit 1
MKITKKGFPEEGDVVLTTIVRISPHAVFVSLDEYEKAEGLVHVSEASKTWVKNLKTHFRVNQKAVCKVIEIKGDGFIHLSIRRVSDYDQRAKWDQIKRQKRVENIIEIVSQKTKKEFEEVYNALKVFEKKYGELYFAFEEAKKKGKDFFSGLDGLSTAVWEMVDKSIALPSVHIAGNLKISSTAGKGIERIKEILSGVEADVTYISAPKYRITVNAVDYKEAEKKLASIVNAVEKRIGKTENFAFEREKKK